MISLDCETTGLDLRHGAKPFLITICDEGMEQTHWEWDVDPLTRKPDIDQDDVDEFFDLFSIPRAYMPLEGHQFILQNPKFDVKALATLRGNFGELWRWENTADTLLAGHLLASNEPHDLTSMALKYLGIDLEPCENRLKVAVKAARNICRTHLKDWRIAKKGLPEMPSAKETVWKNDLWLPRTIWRLEPSLLPESARKHSWATLCSEYANSDSAATLLLFKRQKEILQERDLWNIYLERLKILPIVYEMEDVGVTINSKRLEELRVEYLRESEEAGEACVSIAKHYGHDLHLPKSGNNNSLLEFCFEKMQLPVVSKSPLTGKPSLNKQAMDTYRATLEGNNLNFINSLSDKRKRDTALNYLDGYERFWLHDSGTTYRLHPSLNPTGTATLRWSSSQPNEQNISKQEGFNLRYAFGPAPGREWYSLDADNIELRLPAYEAGETEMIELFEKPDEPPYFGSYHLLVFSILHPDKWDHSDPEGLLKAKKEYTSTWYQWTKNGSFAVQYGAIAESGTADRAYHVPGAQGRIQQRFAKIAKLNQEQIAKANRLGYVETIPDKTVDPERGYPLICARTKWGGVQPTIPLNYHIQSTAMWWMCKAMVRCHEWLNQFPDYHMILQVHDEIVFDFPIDGRNKLRVKRLQKLMEQGGDDLGIPTPVSIEHHPNNWSESA